MRPRGQEDLVVARGDAKGDAATLLHSVRNWVLGAVLGAELAYCTGSGAQTAFRGTGEMGASVPTMCQFRNAGGAERNQR
jgi:hypothetical protein